MARRPLVGDQRWRLVMRPMLALALVAAGCTTQVESASQRSAAQVDTVVTGSTAPVETITAAPSTTTTSGLTTVTTSPAATSTSSPATSEITPTSVAPTTTASALVPPVGQFDCVPADQAATTWEVRPPSVIPAPELPEGWVAAIVGRSVQGRGIEALVRPVDAPRRRVLVIGGLHGNEPATPPAVRGLVGATIASDVEVWLVPESNPDGSAAGIRCNANGVDLNRNFAWEWSAEDGGPAPTSEPETQTLQLLVERLHPDVVVWLHQPLGYVSAIGDTSSALEDAWSAAAGLPVRPDVTQHGGGESWSALVAGAPSMLIEIDGWADTPEVVDAQIAGFEAMLAALG